MNDTVVNALFLYIYSITHYHHFKWNKMQSLNLWFGVPITGTIIMFYKI